MEQQLEDLKTKSGNLGTTLENIGANFENLRAKSRTFATMLDKLGANT